MKVYIAAPYPLRDEAIDVMLRLEALGNIVTSGWLKREDDEGHAAAALDLLEVEEAEVLLVVNPAEWSNRGTGGRHVELGYALKAGKQVVVLGTATNLFHRLNHVRVISRLEDL